MTNDEYEAAVEKVLTDLMMDVEPAVIDGDCWIEQLDVIRMMVKPDSEPQVKAVRSAVYGLLIARLPVTDENVKWLLRDKQLGFGEIDHFENAMALYPAMNEYKGKLKDIYDSYHPHEK
ncbi:hypothetical protein A4U49_12565 [Acidithiobacillus ferrivorans]|uniref:hypothetical protein n=1 Tax=Acidithiobacillus ferrivorans TaxID=160808 RepID=UPI0008935FDB|nr:hypothetical protein [Acidithiobacillus ferrivorans]OFA15496.1 hypothetical protein A4U49_12565 [Acidithiobacillus ferrivorans]